MCLKALKNIFKDNEVTDAGKVDFIFQSYQLLEKRLIDILEIFPFTEENKKSWSPELVSLFLDAGGLFISVCKYIFVSSSRGQENKINNFSINTCEDKVLKKYNLFDYRVVLYRYPLGIILPFGSKVKKRYSYREKNGWWTIYTDLKHNQINNFKKASLGNTLNALASLFLLLCMYEHEEFTKALIRFRWWETDIAIESAHKIRQSGQEIVWYDSKIFGAGNFLRVKTKLSKMNPILASRKFRTFFGRSYL